MGPASPLREHLLIPVTHQGESTIDDMKGRPMDTAALREITDEVSAQLSEMTIGDLDGAAVGRPGDLGDLYVASINRNLRVAAVLNGHRSRGADGDLGRGRLRSSANQYGGGFEHLHRRSATEMVTAFGAVRDDQRLVDVDGTVVTADELYEHAVRDAFLFAWNLASALDLEFQPRAGIIRQVIRSMLSDMDDADLEATVDALVRTSMPRTVAAGG
ncbi:hypothetical protein [Gordonia sp. 'Campus']|uniref:hypothetical protein n=1 Tax=Gordonia sp. 'Campus' TaxID=2915824 RepID=UPI001EE3C03D|nr:hypothetical protein [Gordonia sp. 'Campus']